VALKPIKQESPDGIANIAPFDLRSSLLLSIIPLVWIASLRRL
jgi:hypothetical protein